MDENKDDEISIRIVKKLRARTARSSDCCIFRVPRHLRDVKKEAYEPLMVAIGPYHRHDDRLMGMEEHKQHYLHMLLQRTGEDEMKRYVEAMRSMERRARSFYAEDLSHLPTHEFVEMMLLDSCFIFEVIRQFREQAERRENSAPIFEASCTDQAVFRDLLLVENQLPLFVLLEFCQMSNPLNDFRHMISSIFSRMLPAGVKILNGQALDDRESIEKSRHIVGLLHTVCLPSSPEIGDFKWEFIPPATWLEEAGIKFRKAKEPHSLFDIKFKNGVLEIPTLTIDGRTECFFRNLMAYEEFFRRENLYFGDYILLFGCLINSGEDVELLCGSGIINNWIGDGVKVAAMFNKFGDNATGHSRNFYYSKLFNQVNKYCGRPCNRWVANLRHKYFNSPWAFISLLAAIFLLLLTVAQTVFSVLSHFK